MEGLPAPLSVLQFTLNTQLIQEKIDALIDDCNYRFILFHKAPVVNRKIQHFRLSVCLTWHKLE